MVAWFSSLRVIENGLQAVWMAPTELLAEQHFRSIQTYAEKLAIKTRLVTGSLSAKERNAVLDEISKGGIQFIVGTHALIQEGVQVPRMALGVIDEQRKTVYLRVLEELRRGHQAFLVYPLVEASEQLQHVRDATQMAEKMRQSVFKEFGVGLVHGRMASAERDQVMRAFRDGSIRVLVSTTVIEVGIDIPNATVMVIEHAERFGLSQLHQLRGRVGRGSAAAYCLLVNRAPGNPVAQKRLRVMERE